MQYITSTYYYYYDYDYYDCYNCYNCYNYYSSYYYYYHFISAGCSKAEQHPLMETAAGSQPAAHSRLNPPRQMLVRKGSCSRIGPPAQRFIP